MSKRINYTFEVVGSIATDDVPPDAKQRMKSGPMRELADRIIDEHAQGRVLVLKMSDDSEIEGIRNGTAFYLRQEGLSLRTLTAGRGADRRVYLEVVPHRPRSRGNGRD